MDILTQSLFGLALAQSGLKRLAPQATLLILVGANLPSLDALSILGGEVNYLKYHGGIAHSLLGVFLSALVLASLAYFINKHFLRRKLENEWWRLFLVVTIALSSHLLLGFCGTDGVPLLAPFDLHRYGGDLVCSMDLWILTGLVLGLVVPFIFRLINQEIGAALPRRNYGAIVALILIVGYLGAKGVSHRQAIKELQKITYRDESIIQVAALPDRLSSFGWQGVVETDAAFHLSTVGSFWMGTPPLKQRGKIYVKDTQKQILAASREGPQCQIYLAQARFPLAAVDETERGFQVVWRDLRDQLADSRGTQWVLVSRLDKQLGIELETLER